MFITPQPGKSIMQAKFTPAGFLIVFLLMFALVALGERILYDLARGFAVGPVDYFDNLSVIIVHAFFIIPLLVISIIINVTVSLKNEKYAIVLIPYFIFSVIMALQLALQVAVYFANHHTKIQFYIVMALLVIICTYAIYYIQKKFNPET